MGKNRQPKFDLAKRLALRLPGKQCEPITLWGNPVLRAAALPVQTFDSKVRSLVDQLFETMYAVDSGVGLAANQIGRPESAFVFDCHDGLVGYVINPTILPIGAETQSGGEGCLSLPGFGLETTRLMSCRVVGQDVDGLAVSYEGDGLRARCFQHEVNHLGGRLYIDEHDLDTRTAIELEMRASSWFGTDQLDPRSSMYRQAQG